jgi:hypothetical protein
MISIRNHVADKQDSSRLMLRLHATLAHRCVTSVASGCERKANNCAAGRQRAGRQPTSAPALTHALSGNETAESEVPRATLLGRWP